MKKILFTVLVSILLIGCEESNPIATAYEPDAYFKEYIAIINQSGTKAPTANVIKNTFERPIYFIRSQAGVYLIWSSTSFPIMETIAFVEQPKGDSIRIKLMPSR